MLSGKVEMCIDSMLPMAISTFHTRVLSDVQSRFIRKLKLHNSRLPGQGHPEGSNLPIAMLYLLHPTMFSSSLCFSLTEINYFWGVHLSV